MTAPANDQRQHLPFAGTRLVRSGCVRRAVGLDEGENQGVTGIRGLDGNPRHAREDRDGRADQRRDSVLRLAPMSAQEEMEEVNGILGSVIDELVPIHTTADAFEKGGVECRKFIETLYARLLAVEQIINECRVPFSSSRFPHAM